jgi:hypothetical protein
MLIAMSSPMVIGELIAAGSLHYLYIDLPEALKPGRVIEVLSLSIKRPQN